MRVQKESRYIYILKTGKKAVKLLYTRYSLISLLFLCYLFHAADAANSVFPFLFLT